MAPRTQVRSEILPLIERQLGAVYVCTYVSLTLKVHRPSPIYVEHELLILFVKEPPNLFHKLLVSVFGRILIGCHFRYSRHDTSPYHLLLSTIEKSLPLGPFLPTDTIGFNL